jgi:hypothetical protein
MDPITMINFFSHHPRGKVGAVFFQRGFPSRPNPRIIPQRNPLLTTDYIWDQASH